MRVFNSARKIANQQGWHRAGCRPSGYCHSSICSTYCTAKRLHLHAFDWSKWLKPFHSNGLNGGVFLKDVSHQSIHEPGSNEQWHRLWPHRSHKVLVFSPLPCPPSCALFVVFCVSVWSASQTARQETMRTECEDRTLEELGLDTINVHRRKHQQVYGKMLDRLRRNHTSPGPSLAAP